MSSNTTFFDFSRCRPPSPWISLDLKFVTDQTVTRAELRHRAKFCWNCGRDMAIFRFFKMAAAAMSDVWNYKVLTVGRIISAELRHHAKFRGDWSNRCHDISILDFSKCWQPQAWIFKILHFNDPNGQEGLTASLCKILSKSFKPRRIYVRFWFFKMAAAAILNFGNFEFSTQCEKFPKKTHPCASLRRLSHHAWKSVDVSDL